MKKLFLLPCIFLLIAAGCNAQPSTKSVSPSPVSNQSHPVPAPQVQKPSLRQQLESVSPDATAPVISDSTWPVKVLDVVQIGNHAAYVKAQQADQCSVNLEMLGFDYSGEQWDQFGNYSDNYIFADMKTQTAADTQAINQKVKDMEDEYFAKKVGEDFEEALSSQDYPAAAALFVSTKNETAANIQTFVGQHPLLKNTSGYGGVDYSSSDAGTVVTVSVIVNGANNQDVALVLAKENGAWKIIDVSAK